MSADGRACRGLPERYLAEGIAAVDVEAAARSHGVTDPLASMVFQPGMTSVQRADANREGEVEQFLASTEFELFDGGNAERQVRRVSAECGGATSRGDLKNPQPFLVSEQE